MTRREAAANGLVFVCGGASIASSALGIQTSSEQRKDLEAALKTPPETREKAVKDLRTKYNPRQVRQSMVTALFTSLTFLINHALRDFEDSRAVRRYYVPFE